MKLEISVVGPCYRDDSLGFDGSTREFTVEVQVRESRVGSISREPAYYLSMATSKYTSGWAQPFLRVEASVVGRAISKDELEAKLKQMKQLSSYYDKLPVKPQTMAEWVATIAALHKFATCQLIVYKDHKSRPLIIDEASSVARACNEVAGREKDLVPGAKEQSDAA